MRGRDGVMKRSQRTGLAGAAAIVAASAVLVMPLGPAGAIEVRTDDFRVSEMGPNGATGYEAQQSKLAFDPVNDQYLAVWRGDDEGDGQAEIYGQLIDGRTSNPVGGDFLVAQVGTAGDDATDAIEPAVVWSGTNAEFVVVYTGDEDATDTVSIVSDTFEIYAQRVSTAGAPQGGPLRVSDMGSDDANGSFDANFPDIAWNSTSNQFLVVWQGDDNTAPLVNNETEIHGQLLGYTSGDLVQLGTNDFRISQVGVDGATATDGRAPAVAYNPDGNKYYVAWEGNYNAAAPAVFEVHGTSVSPAGVVASQTGTVLNTIAASDEELQPDVAANPANGDFAVVWSGDNGADEFEIYRQLVDTAGALSGTSLAISAMGSAGNTGFIAETPAITFDTLQQQYVVVWSGDDSTGGMIDDEYEIFLRRLTSAGATSGSAARISTMGVNGVANSTTSLPDVTFSDDTIGAVGTVWNAENQPTTAAGEGEIWGQFDAPGGDLSVTITVLSDTSPLPGAPVSFEIEWENQGTTSIPDVTLTSSVSALFQNAVGAPVPDVTGPPMEWSLGTLAPGAIGTVTVSGTVSNSTVNGDAVTFDASIATGSLVVDTDATDDSDSDSVIVDTPPSLTINQAAGQADPTNASPIDYTVVFSEPVTGFDGSDVSFTGSTVGGTLVATVTGTGPTYTVSVTGMNGVGDVTASIPAGGALDTDGSPEGNFASTSTDNTVHFDNVPPTVTINQAAGQADPTNASPIDFTVVFSEPVVGFIGSDVSFTGSTVGGTLVASVTGVGPTYTVSVTGMTGDGDVVASIPAAVVTDPAGNANDASTSTDNTVRFDNVAPTVTIDQAAGQADPTNASPIDFTVVFSEPVTGFTGSDVSFTGSTVGGTLVASVSGSGPTYTVSVTGMTGVGTVVASIPASAASDAAGNGNTLSTSTDNTVTFDNVAPTVTIDQAGGQGDPTNASPIVFTVVFSESVTGFDDTDVAFTVSTVGGTLVAGVTGSGANYTVSVTGMSGTGTVVASIAAGAAADAAGNASAASTSTDNTVTFDTTVPTVTVNQAAGQADPTNASPIVFTVVFSEPVAGFTAPDVAFTGSTVGGTLAASVTGPGPTYTVSVTGMTGVGDVVVSLAAGAATDLAGNATAASTSTDNTVAFDDVVPTVTIDQAGAQVDPTNASPVLFTVDFSEDVTGFDGPDVSFAGSTVGGTLVANVTGSGQLYTVSVTGMNGAGTVVASIPAGAANDAAGNGNAASTSTDNTVTFDNVPPSVTIDQAVVQADPTNASPIVFTVTFASPVSGFTGADVALGGTAGGPMVAIVSGAGPVFIVSVTGMAGFGTVTATIPAGAATDAAGNPSTASTSTDNTVTFVPGDPNPGVNDPPVLTAPATASAELGLPTVFTGGNAISVVDPDAFGSDVQVMITVTDGTVIVPPSSAATITGAGTASVTITGPMTAVNGTLSTIAAIFTEVGSKAIVVTVSDLGHSPAPALTDTATITVTVVDTNPPVITVPGTVTATTDPGQPGAIVTYVVIVTDLGSQPVSTGLVEAAPPTLTCTPASGSFFPIGTTTVNCTATDSVGNTASASFAVQVVDDEDPTITSAPANVRVTLPPGASSGAVTYTVPSAADNSGTVTVSCTPASGSTFATGTTTVTCTATDPSGNTATATFQVQVVSGVLPPTGGGGIGIVPLAVAALLAGLALVVVTRRRLSLR